MAALVAAAAAVPAGAVDDPWVITTTVTITEPMDVANVIVAGSGELVVDGVADPGFRVTGNLWAIGEGRIVLRNSVIQFMSTYHGQFALAAAENGSVLVTGCDYRVSNDVQHALFSSDNAEMVVEDSDFAGVQLLAAGTAHLRAERLNGSFEVIVQGAARMDLLDIPRDPGEGRLWVWPEFGAGSTAVYSPPLPGLIQTWDFPPAGATGIPQTVHLERCEVFLWPMLVRPGCSLTLRDIQEENWIVVGFHLPNSVTIRGLTNATTYTDATLDLPDRTVRLEKVSVDTWNLYPEERARVVVLDSVVGEILTFGNASTRMERTTVDGTGGFFGAEGDGVVTATSCVFTCDIQAADSSTIGLHNSTVQPYPGDPTGDSTRFGAYDMARLLADGTPVATTPALGGNGLIAVTWLADPPASPPGSSGEAVVHGTAALFSLEGGPAPGRWRLEAVPAWSRTVHRLGEGEGNVEEGGELGRWTDADPTRDYLLRLVLTDAWGRRLVGRQRILGRGFPPPASPPRKAAQRRRGPRQTADPR